MSSIRSANTTEHRWLDYAWGVVNCTPAHRRACEAAGGARPSIGRELGNELRWPGYLGRNYVERRGVLCVGHVHRERVGVEEPDVVHTEATAALVDSARVWLSSGRSACADAKYIASVRDEYEAWLPTWPRWYQHRDLLDGLGMDVTQIAWANLAKCRVPIDDKKAVDRVTSLCQAEFSDGRAGGSDPASRSARRRTACRRSWRDRQDVEVLAREPPRLHVARLSRHKRSPRTQERLGCGSDSTNQGAFPPPQVVGRLERPNLVDCRVNSSEGDHGNWSGKWSASRSCAD